MNNQLPDKSVQLIIADPPYFEVKGEFDFIWKSFDDYLKDVEKWAIECKRLLADNGTLFWYGHAKKIAYAQIIFDKYFNLENNITILLFVGLRCIACNRSVLWARLISRMFNWNTKPFSFLFLREENFKK